MKRSHKRASLVPSLSSRCPFQTMSTSFARRWITHPALALGGSLLWGVVELLALMRSRVAAKVLAR